MTVFQIEEHLQFLHTSYRDIVIEKHQLANRKKLATKRLQCASVLLTVLEDEKARLPLAFYPLYEFSLDSTDPSQHFTWGSIPLLLELSQYPTAYKDLENILHQ